MRVHFIQAENHKTKWQPQEIDDEDFSKILHDWDSEELKALGWEIGFNTRTLTKQIW